MGILTSCITGAFVAIIGLILRTYPPEHINNSIGYKTPFSMKNKDTWCEGNRLCGRMLLFSGIIFIPFSILIRYLYTNNVNLSKSISILGLVILFIASIIFTEIHLRKLFDKDGIRK
ncbi:SdpI family protein [Clostridium sp. YIM B02515]|uniref:SdpI family protein n=1 Tax=Clostridium rhizosphaerae TaxID=2803861 RepID=A0ABS1TBW0_9CLOT|nr:SdpI family protein [Clostridium rhizosphaerae]MBL4936857.1 SdpI family protein [Clostridium rhizosphaerae]